LAVDLTMAMINATVEIDQPLQDGSGKTIYGTGFLVDDPKPDGTPRTVLITSGHVFRDMPGPTARIGFRSQGSDGVWHYAPQTLPIRDGALQLWVRDSVQDVAAIAITAPPEFAKAAIPIAWLADDAAITQAALGPGDEMYVLGFPEGQTANPQGFPILRVGRVASYPLTPAKAFETILLDFNVFRGNSGSPVFLAGGVRRRPGAPELDRPLVAGLVTGQAMSGDERLALGIVADAEYIRDTLKLLDPPVPAPTTAVSAASAALPVSAAAPSKP
jgi:hypothetical protein